LAATEDLHPLKKALIGIARLIGALPVALVASSWSTDSTTADVVTVDWPPARVGLR
jgi:hypothetical protein